MKKILLLITILAVASMNFICSINNHMNITRLSILLSQVNNQTDMEKEIEEVLNIVNEFKESRLAESKLTKSKETEAAEVLEILEAVKNMDLTRE